MLSRDLDNELESFTLEEWCSLLDMQHQPQTSSYQMPSAMDYDLSTGTWEQLPQGSLPANSPLQSVPLQLEVVPINNAPGCQHHLSKWHALSGAEHKGAILRWIYCAGEDPCSVF